MDAGIALTVLVGIGLMGWLFDIDLDFWNNDNTNTDNTNTTAPKGTGGGGGDPVPPTPTQVSLSSGADDHVGTNGDDTIDAKRGNDSVEGGPGDDVILGGGDDDYLEGDSGNDVIAGDDGRGVARQFDGRDVIKGGNGNDILLGDNGADGLYGQKGDDILFGGFGADKLFGSDGEDHVVGHRGSDLVRGGAGNDVISGNMLYQGLMTSDEAAELQANGKANDPADIARLGPIVQRDDLVADTLKGDAGDDDLYIGEADDASGGTGADRFFVSPESGSVAKAAVIKDFSAAEDTIVVQYPADAATAPTITIGADGANAQVLADGKVVATLTGKAGQLAVADVVVQKVNALRQDLPF